jgi:hypothetical protein
LLEVFGLLARRRQAHKATLACYKKQLGRLKQAKARKRFRPYGVRCGRENESDGVVQAKEEEEEVA